MSEERQTFKLRFQPGDLAWIVNKDGWVQLVIVRSVHCCEDGCTYSTIGMCGESIKLKDRNVTDADILHFDDCKIPGEWWRTNLYYAKEKLIAHWNENYKNRTDFGDTEEDEWIGKEDYPTYRPGEHPTKVVDPR